MENKQTQSQTQAWQSKINTFFEIPFLSKHICIYIFMLSLLVCKLHAYEGQIKDFINCTQYSLQSK
jgi:hypothetical protein